jgi:hypothetical protein
VVDDPVDMRTDCAESFNEDRLQNDVDTCSPALGLRSPTTWAAAKLFGRESSRAEGGLLPRRVPRPLGL